MLLLSFGPMATIILILVFIVASSVTVGSLLNVAVGWLVLPITSRLIVFLFRAFKPITVTWRVSVFVGTGAELASATSFKRLSFRRFKFLLVGAGHVPRLGIRWLPATLIKVLTAGIGREATVLIFLVDDFVEVLPIIIGNTVKGFDLLF
jgi:hypothetical protein